MKLNTRGRYAVMAMVDLGLHNRDNQPVPLADIASRQEISLSYLEQLFARLRKAGLVRSMRGPGGGYTLTHGASGTRIADIIHAVDEDLDLTRCQQREHNGCMSTRSQCLTHDLWVALGDQMTAFLGSVTVADVCARRVLTGAPPVQIAPPDLHHRMPALMRQDFC